MIKKAKQSRKIILSFFMPCMLSVFLTASITKKEELTLKRIEANNEFKKINKKNREIEKSNPKEMEKIVSLLENISYTYNWEEFYFSKEEMSVFEFLKNNQELCQNSFEDITNLTEEIILNSVTILPKENRMFLSKEEIKTASFEEIKFHNEGEEILKEALQICFTTSSNQKEDFCRLKNTTIRVDKLSTAILGIYNQDCFEITIDLENCKDAYNNTDKSLTYTEYITLTLAHEINHSRQYACSCKIDKSQINNTIQLFDVGYFLMESSAESQLYDQNLVEGKKLSPLNYSYIEERESEALLFFLSLFDQKKADAYYSAVFDCDLKALYSFFDAESREELYEFYQIVYALDTLHGNTNMYDQLLLIEAFETEMGLKKEVGFTYKNVILKKAIEDLIKYNIYYQDLTLEENIYLYQFVKSHIVNNSYFIRKEENTYYYEYDQDFVKNCYQIEQLFYQFLCLNYKISKEELEKRIIYYPNFDFNKLFTSEKSEMENISLPKLVKKFPLLKNIAWTYQTTVAELDFYEKEMVRYLKP